MFLIRTAFWLALIVMLLPSDKERQARLYNTAVDAVHNAATFCDRNAALCAQGAQHWAVFRTKLDFAAKLVFDVASERFLGVEKAVDRQDIEEPKRERNGRVGA